MGLGIKRAESSKIGVERSKKGLVNWFTTHRFTRWKRGLEHTTVTLVHLSPHPLCTDAELWPGSAIRYLPRG